MMSSMPLNLFQKMDVKSGELEVKEFIQCIVTNIK